MTREHTFRDRGEIEAWQGQAVDALVGELLESNPFYRDRLAAADIDGPPGSLEAYRRSVPFTHKEELVRDQEEHPPYGTNLSRPLEDYVRLHQTSGTTGRPLFQLDTRRTWRWVTEAWRTVLDAAEVGPADRVFVAFSFGPFLGLWLGFEAAQELGALALSGGALDTEGRLEAMRRHRANVLCCTPTYALRLGATAQERGLDPGELSVEKIVVAGEPGGCLDPVRRKIEAAFPGARVFDHYGLTEVGPVTYQCLADRDAMHVAEAYYHAEVVDPETGEPVACDGETEGELVLTNLGRTDAPLLRYRTGDLVRARTDEPCPCGRPSMRLVGGILGRADDMVCVRGINLFPSALDAIVLRRPEVAEYRAEIREVRGMHEVDLLVEPRPELGMEARGRLEREIEEELRTSHHLRIPVRLAEPGSLPRFELKARRWKRE